MMEIGVIQSSNENLKKYCDELRSRVRINNKILFVSLPQFNINNFERKVAINRGYYAYPPVGLECLVESIDNKDLEIEILDLNYHLLKKINEDTQFESKDWLNIFKDKLNEKDYSIVGISNMFNIDSYYFFEISKNLREKDQRIIIAGGQNATYNAKDFLEKGLCDFVCMRESENKINFLLDNIYGENKHTPTPEIMFKYNGKIMKSEGNADIVIQKGNLIEQHKKIPIEDYCKVGSLSPFSRMAGIDMPYSGILFNRGCHGGCKFCDVTDYSGRKIRSRDINDFLEEMRYLVKEKGIGFFEILDDDFTGNKEMAKKVLQGIIDSDIKIKWGSNNGIIASTIDEELMKKIRDSGCIGYKIGVESGNEKILRRIKKPGTLNTFRKFSKISQKFPEIFIVDNYIIGFPEDTINNEPPENFSQIMDSYKFSREMNLDWSSYTIYQVNASYGGVSRDMRKVEDFIPSKNFNLGKMQTSTRVYTGREVFNIPLETIPSYEQKKEIWFTFNLTRNFIHNKNLNHNGNPEKFLCWINSIEERYPTHPYINMFSAFANNLLEYYDSAKNQYNKMIKNLEDDYWKERFRQFSLDEVVKKFPQDTKTTSEAITYLKHENPI